MTIKSLLPEFNLLKIIILVGIVAIPVEFMSFLAGKFLASQALLYDPPHIEDYTSYLNNRDPILGWPSRTTFGKNEFDITGSRIVPKYPDPTQPSCVALFGDSFTWGDEVAPEDAYGNVLSGLMGCRVANYGVGGYGTDQAYLRYKEVIKDKAPIVILGHYSDNIIRNINQDRGFLTNQAIGLKPRFILSSNKLKLIPLPILTEDEHLGLRTHAKEILPYDYFVPGGPSGIHTLKFPYTLSVLGAFEHYRLMARIKGQLSYAQFYEPTHPSQALQVTEAIIKSFVYDAQRRNQKPMVLLIPDEKDLRWLRNHGSLPYAELANRLKSSGIIMPDVAEKINKYLGNRDTCEIYTNCGHGHFNPEGYKLLAEIVFSKLKEINSDRFQEPSL